MHQNVKRKMELVRRLAEQHYEPGRQDRCWRQVWKNHVNPVYPMCYRTFLKCVRSISADPE